jgi:hypothetical protein
MPNPDNVTLSKSSEPGHSSVIGSLEPVARHCHGGAPSGWLQLPVFHSFVAVVTARGTDGKIVVGHSIVVKRGRPAVRSTLFRELIEHVQISFEMRDEVDVLRKRGKVVYSIKCFAEDRRGIKFAFRLKKPCENAVDLGFY